MRIRSIASVFFLVPLATSLLSIPVEADNGSSAALGNCFQSTVQLPGTGKAVISGDDLFVGDPSADVDGASSQGLVRHYKRMETTWLEQAPIHAPEAGSNQNFGFQVLATAERLVVSASTRVSIFQPAGGGWVVDGNIDFAVTNSLGLAMRGDRIALATESEVSIYSEDGGLWTLDGTASPQADPAYPNLTPASFGRELAFWGNHLLVGAEGSDDTVLGTNIGAVYHFNLDQPTPVQVEILLSPTPSASTSFGRALQLNGPFAAIGGTNSRLYAFSLDPAGLFVFKETVTPVGPQGSQYASMIAMENGVLVTQGQVNFVETIHQFRRGVESWEFDCSYRTDGSGFPRSISFDGSTVALSLIPDLVHILNSPTGEYTDRGGAIAGLNGTAPTMSGGCPALNVQATLSITGVAPNALGCCLVSEASVGQPFMGATLSPMQPYLVVFPHTTDALGEVTLEVGLMPAGHFIGRAFYLDAAAPGGVSLSNALELNTALQSAD